MTNGKKLLVGVTGRAGSGKTTFSHLLEKEAEAYFAAKTTQNHGENSGSPNECEAGAWGENSGFPNGCGADARGQVIEADPLAWGLYSKPDVKVELAREFGNGIFNMKGELDRSRLADIVFGDKKKLETLNSIIHPPLLTEIDSRIEKSQTKVVILDAALLLDWPIAENCAIKIAVLARKSVSLERLKIKGYSSEKAQAILSCQRPESEFKKLCGVIVRNNGTVESLKSNAVVVWKEKIAPLLADTVVI